jgi:hypothetical protein
MEHVHLHERERLLAELRPGWSALVAGLVRATGVAIIAGLIVGAAATAAMAAFGFGLSFWLLPLAIALAVGVLSWSCVRAWRAAFFRVTTDRLLLSYPKSLAVRSLMTVRWARRSGDRLEYVVQPSAHATVTVKWNQYQESIAHPPTLWDIPFGTRSVSVRYGAADTERDVCFPAVPFSRDVKHYLDKVESAGRQGGIDDVRPFVLKRRGERW